MMMTRWLSRGSAAAWPHGLRLAAFWLFAPVAVWQPQALAEPVRVAAPQACDATSDTPARSAVDAARSAFSKFWIETEKGWYAGYRTRATKKNPFDLSAGPGPEATRAGVIQARSVACETAVVEGGTAHVVRFTADLYRFNEENTGWARPLRNGLLMQFSVERKDAAWIARDMQPEKGVVEPGNELFPPNVEKLSVQTAWPEPLPGCKRPERWDGKACARGGRQKNAHRR